MARRVSEFAAAGLARIAQERQRKHRVPGLFAGICSGGELRWQAGIGAADVDDLHTPPGPDDQFLIGSNTKTFTAVLVMQLRDEGRLTLDDPLDRHLPEVTHPGVTIRSMLAHVSGMQREPVGDVWESMVNPDRAELVAGFNQAERMHKPHHLFHYSNLAFSMLGELVARLDGRPWEQSLRARLLEPLGMSRTSVGFTGRAVTGYYVPPYSDVPVRETAHDLKALAPCGGLMSTAADLARWSAFVADPAAEILCPDTLEEMLAPQIMTDTQRWAGAFGLGFMLLRSGDRIYAGHTGGMPGFITGLFTDRGAGAGAVVLMNSGAVPDAGGFAVQLLDHVLDHDPRLEPPWRPGPTVPAELAELVGLWFTEGSGVVFSVREGCLEARMQDQPEHVPPARFTPIAADLYRTVAGREQGELLRITRDEHGRVSKLNWATYLVTRGPLAFTEIH